MKLTQRTRRLFSIVMPLAVLFVLGVAYLFQWMTAPVDTQSAMTFEVKRGESVVQIATKLHDAGWLRHPRSWSLWARWSGVSGKLRAGEYQLTTDLSPQAILQLFSSGKVILRHFTIIEGSTFQNVLSLLAQREDIQHTLVNVPDAELIQLLNIPSRYLEGHFFPDTYHFAKNTKDVEILRMASQRMQRELERVWRSCEDQCPVQSSDELLILASIVEKETGKSSERPLIAGVFLERLSRGIRLQSDPTVIYGIGEQYDGNIRKKDLLRDSPYNTYTRKGLPPTPIALPGAASLTAVAHPQRTGAIYFVASGNADGSHVFSKTLQEHNAAVRRYLKNTRAR